MATLGVVSRVFRRNWPQTHNILNSQLLLKAPCRRLLSINASNSSTGNAKLILRSAIAGVFLGGGYAVYSSVKSKRYHFENEETPLTIIDRLPDVRIARKIVNENDKTNLDLVLFQYQTCPFCCKVRTFLDSKGFSYSVVEVDAVLRQDLKWSTYKKVPTLLARTKEGKYVQLTDSSMIISILATVLEDPEVDIGYLAKYYPRISFVDENGKKRDDILNKYFPMYENNLPKGATKESMAEELKWRTWTDNHLIHLISPNVYRTSAEALDTFEWFSVAGEWDQNFPRWERNLMVYVGATAMYFISKMLKKRHNLSDDVRGHMYDALDKWAEELEKRKTLFHGGSSPDLADLAIFGALSSFEGCQAFSDILHNTRIEPWVLAMKEHTQNNKGTIIRSIA